LEASTRNPAVDSVADRTDCEWPSRSSKIDDFHSKRAYVINSHL